MQRAGWYEASPLAKKLIKDCFTRQLELVKVLPQRPC